MVQVKLNVLSKSTRLQDLHFVPVSLASAADDVRSAVERHTNVKATNVRTNFILTAYCVHERYGQILQIFADLFCDSNLSKLETQRCSKPCLQSNVTTSGPMDIKLLFGPRFKNIKILQHKSFQNDAVAACLLEMHTNQEKRDWFAAV